MANKGKYYESQFEEATIELLQDAQWQYTFGDGSLTASPYDDGGDFEGGLGAGIGSGFDIPCGNINI